MSHSYTRSELTEYFFEALDMFNDSLDSSISKKNVQLEFFTPETGIAIYENFCKAHFPNMLEYSARDCAPQPLRLSRHSGKIEQARRWR